MGRKKVELKRIEKKSYRDVTFSKRRNGLFKKAQDLSILCDAQVAILITSSAGKLYTSATPQCLVEILERYWSRFAEEASKPDNGTKVSGKCEILETHDKMLQEVQRQLEDPDTLSVDDLVEWEKNLIASLTEIRHKKNELILESIVALQNKERNMRENNELLKTKIAEIREAIRDGGRNSTTNQIEEGTTVNEDQPNHHQLVVLPPQPLPVTLDLLASHTCSCRDAANEDHND